MKEQKHAIGEALRIQIILGSTRDGRNGESVARMVHQFAQAHKGWRVELLDLKEWNIPLLHDATTPSEGIYNDPIVKKWAEKIAQADAYIIVTPEYNHGYSAVLKNALDVIYKEWHHKPIGFISYGGSAGGARAVEQLRQVAVELQMAPIRESVAIPFIWNEIDEQGTIKNATSYEERIKNVFDSLTWWGHALRNARTHS